MKERLAAMRAARAHERRRREQDPPKRRDPRNHASAVAEQPLDCRHGQPADGKERQVAKPSQPSAAADVRPGHRVGVGLSLRRRNAIRSGGHGGSVARGHRGARRRRRRRPAPSRTQRGAGPVTRARRPAATARARARGTSPNAADRLARGSRGRRQPVRLRPRRRHGERAQSWRAGAEQEAGRNRP
jgi:hypothetical protein